MTARADLPSVQEATDFLRAIPSQLFVSYAIAFDRNRECAVVIVEKWCPECGRVHEFDDSVLN